MKFEKDCGIPFAVSCIAKSNGIKFCEITLEDKYGVQFHPESIMTPDGKQMLYNFINMADGKEQNND